MNAAVAEITEKREQAVTEKKIVTGAQGLLLALLEEGVDTIFGYPGGAIMPIYDALYDFKDQLNHYLVRHEQGGAHAAQGYARITGKPGVCFATSGPGATNLITGILVLSIFLFWIKNNLIYQHHINNQYLIHHYQIKN